MEDHSCPCVEQPLPTDTSAVVMEIDHDRRVVYSETLALAGHDQEVLLAAVQPTEEQVMGRLTAPVVTTQLDTKNIAFERWAGTLLVNPLLTYLAVQVGTSMPSHPMTSHLNPTQLNQSHPISLQAFKPNPTQPISFHPIPFHPIPTHPSHSQPSHPNSSQPIPSLPDSIPCRLQEQIWDSGLEKREDRDGEWV